MMYNAAQENQRQMVPSSTLSSLQVSFVSSFVISGLSFPLFVVVAAAAVFVFIQHVVLKAPSLLPRSQRAFSQHPLHETGVGASSSRLYLDSSLSPTGDLIAFAFDDLVFGTIDLMTVPVPIALLNEPSLEFLGSSIPAFVL